MKIDKELMDAVDVGNNYGVIICCAVYLTAKKSEKAEIGATIHEQVAILTLKGNDVPAIVRKTGFADKTVCSALYDISAFCGARRE